MKKIAFSIGYFGSGGTEVSLVNLLKKMSENKNYDITVFVEKNEGAYAADIPNNVRVVEIFKNSNFLNEKNEIKYLYRQKLSDKSLKEMIRIIFYKILQHIDRVKLYRAFSKETKKIEEEFDYAVDFQGYGSFRTYYILNCIKAKNKYIFIHDERIGWIKKVKKCFMRYDKFLCVSNSCKDIVEKEYPDVKGKVEICRNVIDIDKIEKLSKQKRDFNYDPNVFNILTIGRLQYQKGYDLLVNIAMLLKRSNKKFKWYIIGDGMLWDEIKADIKSKSIEDCVIMLGMKKNPYPYLKECDLYVQPSRHEGYGIAIAEARILKKIVVATNLTCISEQIKNNVNGILCDFSLEDFTTNIAELMDNKEKRLKFSQNIENEEIKDFNDYEKFFL